MEQMTITAKVQIAAADTDKVLLDETMSVYHDACNYVSEYVFRTHDLKQFSLNKVLYSTLREKFGLKSQIAQSVIKTVIARYKTILENQKGCRRCWAGRRMIIIVDYFRKNRVEYRVSKKTKGSWH